MTATWKPIGWTEARVQLAEPGLYVFDGPKLLMRCFSIEQCQQIVEALNAGKARVSQDNGLAAKQGAPRALPASIRLAD